MRNARLSDDSSVRKGPLAQPTRISTVTDFSEQGQVFDVRIRWLQPGSSLITLSTVKDVVISIRATAGMKRGYGSENAVRRAYSELERDGAVPGRRRVHLHRLRSLGTCNRVDSHATDLSQK
jgi:hypothetical protein